MFKYADDTYIVIPAANVNSRYAELDHVDRWAQNNNLSLNKAKSVEIIFTDRKRKPPEHMPPQIPEIRRDTTIKIPGVTMTNPLSAGEHVRDVIGKCAQSLHALKLLRCHGMSDDSLRLVYKAVVLSKLLYASPAWCGVLPVRPTSNVSKQLYGMLFGSACTQLTILRRLKSLKTWMIICLRTY